MAYPAAAVPAAAFRPPPSGAMDSAASRKRGPDGHVRAAIFSPHLRPPAATTSGGRPSAAGTWTGGGTTYTSQSPTLFLTNLDPRVRLELVEQLFKELPGFIAFRSVRRMCFVDFDSVEAANASMRLRQNHRWQVDAAKDLWTAPLLIDYDKDKREKRDKQYRAQVGRELAAEEREQGEYVDLQCAACKVMAFKLKILMPKCLATLPRRPVDNSLVVDTAKYLVELQAARGRERALRRPQGVEMQYHLACKACKASLAYASTPIAAEEAKTPAKHIFVISAAVIALRAIIGRPKHTATTVDLTLAPATQPAAAASAVPPAAGTAAAAVASATAAAATTPLQATPAASSDASHMPIDVDADEGSSEAAAPPADQPVDAVADSPPASLPDAAAATSADQMSDVPAAAAAACASAAAAAASPAESAPDAGEDQGDQSASKRRKVAADPAHS